MASSMSLLSLGRLSAFNAASKLLLNPVRVAGGAGASPSLLQASAGYTLDSPPAHQMTNTERQTTTHSHSHPGPT